ncbi:variant erythrocyte surface antigen-1 family protein [Babesia caballi]|uniref:Variant erythrocyte surface antigen-1 family protein n=1 Tax=Babesia caballi TaxID=5871 RepID=A0AAV4LNC9_BABCB|nr:variant erythrocyte surface antigen-1 family protein [Babesia caballi]
MAPSGGKPLTDPPKDVKEAIDWLALVGGGYGGSGCGSGKHKELAAALRMLPGFAPIYNPIFPNDWLSEIIYVFALALDSAFLEYNGRNSDTSSGGTYTSAYSVAGWTDDKASEYAKIFLFLAVLIYYFITFLYCMCKPSDSPNAGFTELSEACGSGNSASSYETFLSTLEANGPSKRPEYPLTTCKRFSYEYLQSRYSGTDITNVIDDIKKELVRLSETLTLYSTSSTSYFSKLTEYISSLLGKIQSFDPNSVPSPVAPLAGGLVGVGALGTGAAYGLNLFGFQGIVKALFGFKVTGKDGGGGTGDGTAALSSKVQNLLEEVEDSGIKLDVDIDKVITALGNGNLITNMAKGLKQFIGYDATSKGTPKITGGGILPANVAKHQVCNAVLNFVIRFLEGLCEIEKLIGESSRQTALTVIGKLRKCVGTGKVPKGFKELVNKIGEKVRERFDKKIKQSNQTGKLNSVFTQLKEIKVDETGSPISHETTAVQDFLNKVEGILKTDNSGNFATYCDKLKSLFENSEITSKAKKNDAALTYSALESNINAVTGRVTTDLNSDIYNLKTKSQFKDYANVAVFTAVRDAAHAFLAEIKEPIKYTSYYDKAQWNNVSGDDDRAKCAKIFLGCLPLYYQALTYIYWGCHDNGGRWRNLTLANGSMRSYFDSQGLLPLYVDKSKRGAHIADSALGGFSEFTQGMAGASSPFPYVSFTKELQANVRENANNLPTECPLSALYHGTSCYFRYQQIATTKHAVNTPKTIREMLYFLAAMPYSTSYEGLEKHIGDVLKEELDVADSGSSQSGNKLSADQLKEYLTASSAFSSSVLGLIQGPGASEKSEEPWLHELFCNSAFHFKYPSSSSTLFSKVSNYAYALQFQLHFLYQQCSNTYTLGCGWQNSRRVNTTAPRPPNVVPVAVSPPPLQAFLTDNLKGFSRGHPSDPSSHLAECSGPICHVPMGFTANDLRDSSTVGAYIHHVLKPLCGSFNSPLLQLCGTLTCLSKRAPRSLGDLFGFYWQVTGQLFKNKSPTLGELIEKFDKAFDLGNNLKQTFSNDSYVALTLLWNRIKCHRPLPIPRVNGPCNPVALPAFMARDAVSLPVMLFDLKQQCHKVEVQNVGKVSVKHSVNSSSHHNCFSTPADLFSLQTSRCNNGQNCGPYLSPLNHTTGTAFAPIHASSYLSWVIYLAEDLHSRFQEMHDDSKNITCIPSSGSHGPSGSCSCPSVVECAEVLLILHANGFTFASAGLLKNGGGQPSGKKSCQNFHDQLSAVLANDENTPLFKLLTVIDDFLYAIRCEFFSNSQSSGPSTYA